MALDRCNVCRRSLPPLEMINRSEGPSPGPAPPAPPAPPAGGAFLCLRGGHAIHGDNPAGSDRSERLHQRVPMSELFDLSMPWWVFVLRAAAVYAVLMVLIRASGKRTMGQFTPFDMLVIVLLGSAVQNSLLGKDTSLGGGLLLAVTLVAINWCVAFVTSRSARAERIVEGAPVVLARDGQLFRSVLRRELVSEQDFNEALRQNGQMTLTDVRIALLETNGSISVVPRDSDSGKPTSAMPDDSVPDDADQPSSDSQSRGSR